ncbi:MAG: response regulator transcription factor [Planctomycetota bacterium]
MPPETKIRVLIVDDQEVVRFGVKSLLEGTEIKVVAEATNGPAAVKYAVEKEVDIVLMDVRMPDGDGLTALGRIKLEKPNLPILLISAFENPAYVARGVAMGANGHLLKGCTRDDLLNAIRLAVTGGNIWTHEALRRVSSSLRTPRLSGDLEASLSEREGEVLRQIAHGLTNKQIALALHISYETVKEHVQHIFRKIGIKDRTQAAVWAVRKQLV